VSTSRDFHAGAFRFIGKRLVALPSAAKSAVMPSVTLTVFDLSPKPACAPPRLANPSQRQPSRRRLYAFAIL
jgi:hypothetical protein